MSFFDLHITSSIPKNKTDQYILRYSALPKITIITNALLRISCNACHYWQQYSFSLQCRHSLSACALCKHVISCDQSSVSIKIIMENLQLEVFEKDTSKIEMLWPSWPSDHYQSDVIQVSRVGPVFCVKGVIMLIQEIN